MTYWQRDIETLSRERLQLLQLERLKATVRLAYHSPFYRKVFDENGITAAGICSLDDLKTIPFTTKEDLHANYPFGMAAIPVRDCVRLHSSSGTTGKPTVVLHSQKDLDEWAHTVLRIAPEAGGLQISGLTSGETLSIYTLQGKLVYESKASSPEEYIYLQDKSVYILMHKGKAYKFGW